MILVGSYRHIKPNSGILRPGELSTFVGENSIGLCTIGDEYSLESAALYVGKIQCLWDEGTH